MQAGVEVEASKTQKDELVLFGNSLEAVSQSAADIQQICKVRNKDIRKVRRPTPPASGDADLYILCGQSLTLDTVPRRYLRLGEAQRG